MSSPTNDEEILSDNSISKLEFTFESGLVEIVDGLDTLKSVTNSANLLESEEYSLKMIRIVMIANDLMVNQIKEVFTKILRDNRYVSIANLYIWLLNKYKLLRNNNNIYISETWYFF